MDNGRQSVDEDEYYELLHKLDRLEEKRENFNANNVICNTKKVLNIAKNIKLNINKKEAQDIIDSMKRKIDKYILYELQREWGYNIDVDYKI